MLIVVVSALVLSFLIKTFFFQSFWIPSGSMEPTLVYGDRILVTKWRPDPLPLRRGDIIVFKDPGGWLDQHPEDASAPKRIGKDILTFTGLLPEDAGEHLVKRIIGLPGDHVECDDPDGKVKLNGEELTETYIMPGSRPCGVTFSVDIPEGRLWVMGDNRDNSEDSRYHQGLPGGGTMPRDHIVGVAFALVWPFDRFGGLGNPWGADAVSEDDLAAQTSTFSPVPSTP